MGWEGCSSGVRVGRGDSMIHLAEYLQAPTRPQLALSYVAADMEGSRILAAAYEARVLRESGVEVTDLTIGDYAPEQYCGPRELLEEIAWEVVEGRNNYPPSDGVPALQEAVRGFYAHALGVEFPAKTVVVCGGARPPIYAIFRCLVNPGDVVAYPTPSWNNDYYCQLTGARALPLPTSASTNFMPTPAQVRDAVSDSGVRLFCLNSPSNPCGTVIDPVTLRGITQVIVEENISRARAGLRPLYFMFDMVYWPLAGEGNPVHPLALVPEAAPYTLYVDAVSKWLVGTGLRLGWAVVPPHLYTPLRDFMGHVGAWGPRPVQVAVAKYLSRSEEVLTFTGGLREQVRSRQALVGASFTAWATEGLPVKHVAPTGAIYVSVRFNVIGKKTPTGNVLDSNTAIRRYLLNEARVALVAFQAFGMTGDTGWFRISVGAVSLAELEAGLARVREALLLLK